MLGADGCHLAPDTAYDARRTACSFTSLFDRRAAYLQPFRPDHDHGTSLITDVTYLVTENWANSVLEILASLFVAAPFVAIGGYFMFKTCRHRR